MKYLSYSNSLIAILSSIADHRLEKSSGAMERQEVEITVLVGTVGLLSWIFVARCSDQNKILLQ